MANKVDKEIAVAEFERWAETFEIDINIEHEDEKEAAHAQGFRDKFVKRVMDGKLLLNDDDEALHFTPRGSDTALVFKEPMGTMLSARQKKDNDAQAARRTLAAWCGVAPTVFAQMPLREFNFCSELLGFFANS